MIKYTAVVFLSARGTHSLSQTLVSILAPIPPCPIYPTLSDGGQFCIKLKLHLLRRVFSLPCDVFTVVAEEDGRARVVSSLLSHHTHEQCLTQSNEAANTKL